MKPLLSLSTTVPGCSKRVSVDLLQVEHRPVMCGYELGETWFLTTRVTVGGITRRLKDHEVGISRRELLMLPGAGVRVVLERSVYVAMEAELAWGKLGLEPQLHRRPMGRVHA